MQGCLSSKGYNSQHSSIWSIHVLEYYPSPPPSHMLILSWVFFSFRKKWFLSGIALDWIMCNICHLIVSDLGKCWLWMVHPNTSSHAVIVRTVRCCDLRLAGLLPWRSCICLECSLLLLHVLHDVHGCQFCPLKVFVLLILFYPLNLIFLLFNTFYDSPKTESCAFFESF